jgi:hypothetical protein
VEAKTTGLGKFFPFCVTATDVRCSEDVGERPQLFRVFDSGRAPRAYVLAGRCAVPPGADAVPGDDLRSARLRGGGRYTGGHKVAACGGEVRLGGTARLPLNRFPSRSSAPLLLD